MVEVYIKLAELETKKEVGQTNSFKSVDVNFKVGDKLARRCISSATVLTTAVCTGHQQKSGPSKRNSTCSTARMCMLLCLFSILIFCGIHQLPIHVVAISGKITNCALLF